MVLYASYGNRVCVCDCVETRSPGRGQSPDDPEQGQPCADGASDRVKGRHLTNPIYKELPN